MADRQQQPSTESAAEAVADELILSSLQVTRGQLIDRIEELVEQFLGLICVVSNAPYGAVENNSTEGNCESVKRNVKRIDNESIMIPRFTIHFAVGSSAVHRPGSVTVKDGLVRLVANDKPTIRKLTVNRHGTAVSAVYARTWILLDVIHELLTVNKFASMREIYYMFAEEFSNQREVNAIVRDIASMLNVPRHALHIHASSRGYIFGQLTDGRSAALDAASHAPVGILGNPDSILQMSLTSSAVAILVVEKDAVFQRLIDEGLHQRLSIILITGCGFPDISTRVMLWKCAHDLSIPVLGLYDFNPSGLAIHITYAHGSVGSAGEGYAYAVPITWIGISMVDASTFVATPQRQQLTAYDERMISRLSSSPIVLAHPSYRKELENMKACGWKAEIEGLYAKNLAGFLIMLEQRIAMALRHP